MFTVLAGLLTVLCLHQSLGSAFYEQDATSQAFTARLTRGARSAVSRTMRNTATAERYKAERERKVQVKQIKKKKTQIPFHSFQPALVTESIQLAFYNPGRTGRAKSERKKKRESFRGLKATYRNQPHSPELG